MSVIPISRRLARLSRLNLESGTAGRDFPARPREFPVPGHRESVARTVERRGKFGSGASRRSRISENSLYFPCRSGNSRRDGFALDCSHRHLVCVSGDFLAGARAVGKIPAIPRGFGVAAPRGGTGDAPSVTPERAIAGDGLYRQLWRFRNARPAFSGRGTCQDGDGHGEDPAPAGRRLKHERKVYGSRGQSPPSVVAQ